MRWGIFLAVIFTLFFSFTGISQVLAAHFEPLCDVEGIIDQLGQPQFTFAHLAPSSPDLPDATVSAQYLFTLEPGTKQVVIKGFFPHLPTQEIAPFRLLARLPSLNSFYQEQYYYALGVDESIDFRPSTQLRTHFEFRIPIDAFSPSRDHYVFPGPLKIYLNCPGGHTLQHLVDWPVAFYFPVYQRFTKVQRAGYFALASNGVLNPRP